MPGIGRRVMVAACVALFAAPAAWATIDNLKAYKQAYPGKDAKEYSCKICHESAIGKKGDLNSYGKALQQLPAPANTKKLTVDDFKAAEAADPDGDGATTGQELAAGTDPIDPASKPPEAAAPATPAAETLDSSSVPNAAEKPDDH